MFIYKQKEWKTKGEEEEEEKTWKKVEIIKLKTLFVENKKNTNKEKKTDDLNPHANIIDCRRKLGSTCTCRGAFYAVFSYADCHAAVLNLTAGIRSSASPSGAPEKP